MRRGTSGACPRATAKLEIIARPESEAFCPAFYKKAGRAQGGRPCQGVSPLKGSPAQGELSAELTEGSPSDRQLGGPRSLRHGCAVTPPFAQGRLFARVMDVCCNRDVRVGCGASGSMRHTVILTANISPRKPPGGIKISSLRNFLRREGSGFGLSSVVVIVLGLEYRAGVGVDLVLVLHAAHVELHLVDVAAVVAVQLALQARDLAL